MNVMSQRANAVTKKCPPSEHLNTKLSEFIHFYNSIPITFPSELKLSPVSEGTRMTYINLKLKTSIELYCSITV